MIIYMLQRVFRYRAVISSVFIYRTMAYVYFIPLVMIPSLLLVTSISIGFGNSRTSRIIEKVIIIISVAVSAIALTNDLLGSVFLLLFFTCFSFSPFSDCEVIAEVGDDACG